MSHNYMVLALTTTLCAFTYLAFNKKRQSTLRLPPSLRSYPLVGHLFSLPSSDEYIAYRDIGAQLNSDIISFTILGQVIVVLNSIGATTDLLIKRFSIYSDRAELPMLNDEKLVGWGKNTGFLPYGDRWKYQRNMTQVALKPSAGEEIWLKMIKQVRLSMQRLLRHPEGIVSEIQWMTAAIILSSVYGYEASYPSDDLVRIVETAVSRLTEAGMPGNFYVNTITWLKFVPSWFPGAGWKRKADVWRAEKETMINEPFEWTKSQMARGAALPSILKNLLTKLATSEPPKHGIKEEEDMIRWTVGTLYVAGADTTVASMRTLVLAMVLHPDIQRKAQEELDTVLGGARLPDLSDRESLPYMNCVLKELLRWRTVVPLGIPRACSKDDEYKGFRIPKGAIVLSNIWAISNNPSVYPDPDTFNPDRFLNTSTPVAPAFGFGRR
ncbi:hypothetical protein FRC07_013767 [Ceratobasidium sp. 392]|nr:hypothetical protein FRC07_013767 [Ceratobasidium sp. 392]